jgi:hypothetical protein
MPDDRGITLAEAKTQLAAWMTADAQLASGAQSVRVNTAGTDRTVTRADAEQIRKNIEFWDYKVRELAGGGGIQVYGVIPLC